MTDDYNLADSRHMLLNGLGHCAKHSELEFTGKYFENSGLYPAVTDGVEAFALRRKRDVRLESRGIIPRRRSSNCSVLIAQ